MSESVPSRIRDDVLVSVMVCTWNPRRDVLSRVLDALARQTLSPNVWELLIIDNGSVPPVEMPEFPDGRIHCRLIVEPVADVTNARIRGIREARGALIVIVDDDNVLDPGYLAEVVTLAETRPNLGAFGGRISPDFGAVPPAWLRPFHAHLALVDFEHDAWSNRSFPRDVVPCGAGMCIRRPLAEAWADKAESDPRRLALGRKGDSLIRGEDTDMALICIDQGYATGRFTALHLTHVIHSQRLEFEYQRRLARDLGLSNGRLLAMRGDLGRVTHAKVWLRTWASWLGLKYRGPARSIDLAYYRGFLEGARNGGL